jgi:hypothetical protein
MGGPPESIYNATVLIDIIGSRPGLPPPSIGDETCLQPARRIAKAGDVDDSQTGEP